MNAEVGWPPFDWRGRRVIVTGGAGFLGHNVVARLRARGLSEEQIVVPQQVEYDLRRLDAIERLLDVALARCSPADLTIIHLAGNVGGIGYNREHPGELSRQPDHGCPAYRSGRGRPGLASSSPSAPSARTEVHAGALLRRAVVGRIPRGDERARTGWPRKCRWCKPRLTGSSTVLKLQYPLPVNLYGPGDNFNPASSHVNPALVKKLVEAEAAGLPEVAVRGDGTPTREFLLRRGCSRGHHPGDRAL